MVHAERIFKRRRRRLARVMFNDKHGPRHIDKYCRALALVVAWEAHLCLRLKRKYDEERERLTAAWLAGDD